MNDETLTFKDTFQGVFKAYNVIKKEYANGIVKLKKNSFITVKGLSKKNQHNGTSSEEQLYIYLKKRMKERKEKIIDLALNNSHWQYFITLTFDVKQIGEPYTHEKAIASLTRWVNNQKHQNKNMSYLLVSEFHKKGHLHFHGLVANVPKWHLIPARYHNSKRLKKINGKQIYDLENYKLGFVEVSEIESQERVSVYISKYVTKDIMNIKNKKTFWYSTDLLKPNKTFSYTDKQLLDYLDNDNVTYYDKFDTDYRSIEVAEVRKAT